jgi:hypothetical protein
VNVYLRLWLTCPLLLEALLIADLWKEFNTTYPSRLCLFRVLLCITATVKSFPLSKYTGGGGTTPTFSGQLVYLQFTWEVPLPHSPVESSS